MAMQRPSDEMFDSIMLIEAFQSNGITAVLIYYIGGIIFYYPIIYLAAVTP